MSPKMERLDKYLLWLVCFTIITVVVINFITSYGHIYAEGMQYGEYGVDARLMPVGIDGMLLALGLANVFAAKFNRNHWLLRSALGFGVAGTVAVNGAYGAGWGMTGGLLATWSPVALFITVEAGLFVFRVVGDLQAEAAKEAKADTTPKRGRPVGSKTKPKDPETVTAVTETPGNQLALSPIIKGTVRPVDPFHDLRSTGQFPTVAS